MCIDQLTLLQLPLSAIGKGLFMTVALTTLAGKGHDNAIFWLALVLIAFTRRFSWLFYVFFGTFWTCMEIFILQFARGHAWIYPHANVINIPLYLFPLWALVSEMLLDIYEYGNKQHLWKRIM